MLSASASAGSCIIVMPPHRFTAGSTVIPGVNCLEAGPAAQRSQGTQRPPPDELALCAFTPAEGSRRIQA
jgi:hypothetical protein